MKTGSFIIKSSIILVLALLSISSFATVGNFVSCQNLDGGTDFFSNAHTINDLLDEGAELLSGEVYEIESNNYSACGGYTDIVNRVALLKINDETQFCEDRYRFRSRCPR